MKIDISFSTQNKLNSLHYCWPIICCNALGFLVDVTKYMLSSKIQVSCLNFSSVGGHFKSIIRTFHLSFHLSFLSNTFVMMHFNLDLSWERTFHLPFLSNTCVIDASQTCSFIREVLNENGFAASINKERQFAVASSTKWDDDLKVMNGLLQSYFLYSCNK